MYCSYYTIIISLHGKVNNMHPPAEKPNRIVKNTTKYLSMLHNFCLRPTFEKLIRMPALAQC